MCASIPSASGMALAHAASSLALTPSASSVSRSAVSRCPRSSCRSRAIRRRSSSCATTRRRSRRIRAASTSVRSTISVVSRAFDSESCCEVSSTRAARTSRIRRTSSSLNRASVTHGPRPRNPPGPTPDAYDTRVVRTYRSVPSRWTNRRLLATAPSCAARCKACRRDPDVPIRRHEQDRQMAPDDLLGGIAEQTLGADAP